MPCAGRQRASLLARFTIQQPLCAKPRSNCSSSCTRLFMSAPGTQALDSAHKGTPRRRRGPSASLGSRSLFIAGFSRRSPRARLLYFSVHVCWNRAGTIGRKPACHEVTAQLYSTEWRSCGLRVRSVRRRNMRATGSPANQTPGKQYSGPFRHPRRPASERQGKRSSPGATPHTQLRGPPIAARPATMAPLLPGSRNRRKRARSATAGCILASCLAWRVACLV